MSKSLFAAAAAAVLIGPCEVTTGVRDGVVRGTWGGENAGLIADDSSAHVHIGCTFGNVPRGIEPGRDGAFDVAGAYVLRAYPVYVGPALPARFQGTVTGLRMTLSVTVTDTTASPDTTARLGPVQLMYGREPRMQVCPICRTPAARMRR